MSVVHVMSYSECSPDDSGLGGEGQQGEGADEEQGLDHGGGGGDDVLAAGGRRKPSPSSRVWAYL